MRRGRDGGMRINFLVGGVDRTGGMRVVLEYANRLTDRGHSVRMVCPATFNLREFYGRGDRREVSFKEWLKRWGRYCLAERRVSWFDLRATLRVVPSLQERYVPDADISIATFWPTAQILAGFGPRKGRPVYFVQGYEIWAGPRDRVDATYRLPMKKFVVSSWLKRLMADRFGQEAAGPVLSGVNFSQFYNEAKVFHDPPRIGMLYRTAIWRGTGDGLRGIELVRRRYPEVRLVMFGEGWPAVDVPEDAEFHPDPPQEKLRYIYSGCDIWVNPSWHEGLPLSPMEAMACQCALVTTDVGVEDYVVPGVTALVVPPREPEALAGAALKLLDDPGLLRSISQAGYEHIRTFTWEKAVVWFEEELHRVLDA